MGEVREGATLRLHDHAGTSTWQILQGLKKPLDCPAFGTLCNPQNPLGATMVSSEGACAAYFRHRRQ